MIKIDKYSDLVNAIHEHEICLVKIGTECCGPCKIVEKNIESIEKFYDDVYFIKVDAEEADEIVEKFEVRSVPVVLVIKNGMIVSKTVGLQTSDQINSRL